MKYNIYNINCALFGYKFYQKEISKIGVGDSITLKIKQKENGYKDVFAYNGNEEIGELFKDESEELFPLISNPDKFKIEAVVKKLLVKENDMLSVIIDIDIHYDEGIDIFKYIEDFYETKTNKGRRKVAKRTTC